MAEADVKLTVMPPKVSSAGELLAMAFAIEQQAARHYRDLASRMRLRHQDHLAGLFTFLAEIEEKHASKVEDSARHAHYEPVSALPPGWQPPETFEEEEAESYLLTPYRALALAVRSEDRAFAFYSYVAADAPDEQTRQIAEELAKDELEHGRLLRRERRAAFRAEMAAERGGRVRAAPASQAEFWRITAEEEYRAAGHHRALAARLAEKDAGLARVFADAAADEEACAQQAADRAGIAPPSPSDIAEPSLTDGLRLLEEAFERYTDTAERTADETLLQEAQILAERAVRRLSLVRGSLSDAALALGGES